MPPNVSIVIRSYNEEAHIGKLLLGIRLQNLNNEVEVLVVDSGSTDRTVEIAERHGATIVRIAKEDFSFGLALNRGCQAAKGEILVFASAHVYPIRTDWLEKLIEPFQDPKVVLSYGRQVGNTLTQFSEHQIFKSWFPVQSISRQPHNFCNNANCAVKKSVWTDNHYNEELTGLEDLAWAKEVRQQGWQISYSAEATVAHVHEETWARIRNRYRREAMALKQIEPTISFGLLSFLWLTWNNIAADMVEALRHGVFGRHWLSIILFRYNQFYGTWRGHKSHHTLDQVLRARFYYPAEPTQIYSNDVTPNNDSDGYNIDYPLVQPFN